jgi:hypothetical protein
VTGVVGSALADPGGGALDVAASLDVTGAFEAVVFFSPHAAISAVAVAVVIPSSASLRRASRLDNKPST